MNIKFFSKKAKRGFGLVEMVIVSAIVSALSLGAIVAVNPSAVVDKAQDGIRKSNINRVKIVLEEYLNDKDCYPQTIPFGQTWTVNNVPMLDLPQDPKYPTESYYYVSGPGCARWYSIFYRQLNGNSASQSCDLAADCQPQNYNSTWNCNVSGKLDCSVISALVLPVKQSAYIAVAPTNAPTAAPTVVLVAASNSNSTMPVFATPTVIYSGTTPTIQPPTPTVINSGTIPVTQSPTPTAAVIVPTGIGVSSIPPMTADSEYKQASDGSWCYDSKGSSFYGFDGVNYWQQTKQYSTPGFCIDKTGMYPSYCSGNTTRDYYCNYTYNGTTYSNYHCSNGGYVCSANVGNSCSDGVCTVLPSPTAAPASVPINKTLTGADGTYCYDTDGSANYDVSGTCTDNTGKYVDYCNGNNIIDYNCSGTWNGVVYTKVKCHGGQYFGNSCNNGARSYSIGATGVGGS